MILSVGTQEQMIVITPTFMTTFTLSGFDLFNLWFQIVNSIFMFVFVNNFFEFWLNAVFINYY